MADNDSSLGGGQYQRELGQLGETYDHAMSMSVKGLTAAITAASQSSLIGVGSGGSFTVASLLCNLHESHTGRVSRPSTPAPPARNSGGHG